MPPRRSSRQRRPTPRADALLPAAFHLASVEGSTPLPVESSPTVIAFSQNNATSGSGAFKFP